MLLFSVKCTEFVNLLSYACIVQVPHVNRVEYQLIDISEDGFVRLLIQTWPLSVHPTLSFWQVHSGL